MTHDNDVFVKFSKVQKSYDGQTLVVKDLNVDIAKGEFLTLLGPSGSGKTTCLMMLAGFESATHGEIFLNGQPINHVPPYQRGIGMVFQNYALFPHMSVAENLAFPLEIRKMPKDKRDKKVQEVLDMVELGPFGNRRPAQLSGGQQQRVAVARALVFDPALVLMDEPLGALDKQLREQMQYEIKRLHDKLGLTVVYVTHDQTEALTMSDRVAVFNDGIIQQLSPPDELYEVPQNSFVAQFIGENNKLSGKVSSRLGNKCEVTLNNGVVLKADATHLGEHTMTTISLRPERVEIEPAEPMDNMVEGYIKEILYLGDHLRVVMRVAEVEEFIVKVRNRSDKRAIAAGDTVKVGWQADDCNALDPV